MYIVMGIIVAVLFEVLAVKYYHKSVVPNNELFGGDFEPNKASDIALYAVLSTLFSILMGLMWVVSLPTLIVSFGVYKFLKKSNSPVRSPYVAIERSISIETDEGIKEVWIRFEPEVIRDFLETDNLQSFKDEIIENCMTSYPSAKREQVVFFVNEKVDHVISTCF